jgi:uncharacterized OB-fold protein
VKPRRGWECPKCGRVYAPWVFACQNCSHKPKSFTTAGLWNRGRKP